MSKRFISVALLVTHSWCGTNACFAFLNHVPIQSGGRHQFKKLSIPLQSSNGDDIEYTTSEVQEMDDLIISLSLEPSDKSRRQRVSAVFAEELAKVDSSKRFAFLFDQVLAVVGDRVQVKAKKRAMEQQEINNEEESEDAVDDSDEEGDFLGMGKSAEEKQLWALVDMMVQSKTLAKKAFGELGSKGTLQ